MTDQQKIDLLMEALICLVTVADDMIPNDNPSNSQLADAESVISQAYKTIEAVKKPE